MFVEDHGNWYAVYEYVVEYRLGVPLLRKKLVEVYYGTGEEIPF